MHVPKVYPVYMTLSQINDVLALVNEKRIAVEKGKRELPKTLEMLEDLRMLLNDKLDEIGFGGL